MSTWSDCFPDTVTVAAPTGAADDGTPTFGAQSEIACMYVDGANVTRNADGEIVDVSATFYTHDEVGDGWAVWVPGTDTTDDDEARTPESVTEYHDFEGDDDLWEVTL